MSNTILLEQFRDKQVRIIRSIPKDASVPVNDIADALEYDRSALHQLLKRNEAVLSRFSSMVIITTEAGPREMVCLNRDGVMGLLMKLDFNRIKDESKRQTVIEFQVWAIETLGRIIDGEFHQPDFTPWADPAGEHLKYAKLISDSTGVKPGIAFAAAIAQGQLETGRDLSAYQKLLPPAEHETGYLTATDIGKRLDLSAVKVNKVLAGAGFISKQEDQKQRKVWRITEAGKEHGEEFPFVKNGHSGYQIRWSESVLTELRGIGT